MQWVDEMASAGASQYTFHLEATSINTYFINQHAATVSDAFILVAENPRDLIKKIKDKGMKVCALYGLETLCHGHIHVHMHVSCTAHRLA